MPGRVRSPQVPILRCHVARAEINLKKIWKDLDLIWFEPSRSFINTLHSAVIDGNRFQKLHRNAPDAEWLTTRFVGIKMQDASAFEPFLRLSKDYLAGVPIPDLKQH